MLSDIPAGSYFEITLPTTPADFSFSSSNSSCTSVFSTATLACVYTSGTKTMKVSGMFPSGNSDGQYGISINGFFTGAATGASSSFSMSVKNTAGYLIV